MSGEYVPGKCPDHDSCNPCPVILQSTNIVKASQTLQLTENIISPNIAWRYK